MSVGHDLNARLERHPALREIYQRVSRIPPADAGHAFDHTVRVAKLCGKIFFAEFGLRNNRAASELEIDSAIAAGLLHDCVPVAKHSPLRKQSAELCAREAEKWLKELGWEASHAHEIVQAIEDHSYSSGRVPRSLIGEVLQDADRLEALGAIGLYRTIATGVSMGTALFDPADPWAERRELDDRQFTIDHFFTKLVKLPATFRTHAARAEAERRSDYLLGYAAQLKSELL